MHAQTAAGPSNALTIVLFRNMYSLKSCVRTCVMIRTLTQLARSSQLGLGLPKLLR